MEMDHILFYNIIRRCVLRNAIINYNSNKDNTTKYRIRAQRQLDLGADPFEYDDFQGSVPAVVLILRDRPGLIDLLEPYLTIPDKSVICCGTALFHTSERRLPEDLEKQRKIPVNPSLSTVYHTAVQYNRFKVVDLLRGHGLNPNLRTNAGYTALHFATSSAMVKKLVKIGADINATVPNNLGGPLKIQIINTRNLNIIKTFLELGADYRLSNHDGDFYQFICSKFETAGSDHQWYLRVMETLAEHVESKKFEDFVDADALKISEFSKAMKEMKAEKIGDSSVSYWRFLKSTDRQAGRFFRSLTTDALDIERFPYFSGSLRHKMETALKFKEAEDSVKDFLFNQCVTFGKLPQFTYDILDKFTHQQLYQMSQKIKNT